MMRFQDIPQFTRNATYKVDVSWSYLEQHLKLYQEWGLDLDPDFQRAHVWKELQQRRYVEYILRGGAGAKSLYFNAKGWNRAIKIGTIEIVDGKQRLEAVRRFMRGDLGIFERDGRTFKLQDFTDKPDLMSARFEFCINDLDSRAEVLQWYLDLNGGGVLHTEAELRKVRDLLARETQPKPST